MRILFFVIATLQAWAQPQVPAKSDCDLCRRVETLLPSMQKPSADRLREALDLMSRAQLSAHASVQAQEAAALLKLAVKVIPNDDTGTSDEYFFNSYEKAPKVFDPLIEKLPAKDRKMIRKSLKHTEHLENHGNG